MQGLGNVDDRERSSTGTSTLAKLRCMWHISGTNWGRPRLWCFERPGNFFCWEPRPGWASAVGLFNAERIRFPVPMSTYVLSWPVTLPSGDLYCKAAAVAVWVSSSSHHWRACCRILVKTGRASSSRTRILARVRSCSPSTNCRHSRLSFKAVDIFLGSCYQTMGVSQHSLPRRCRISKNAAVSCVTLRRSPYICFW